MKTKKTLVKRVVSLLLTLLMVLSLVPMSVFSTSAADEPVLNEEGYYEIETYDDLCWYRDKVNDDSKDINAILMNDIVVNENVLDADGKLNSGTFSKWEGIGDSFDGPTLVGFYGTFDGNGKTISGVYTDFSQGGFFRENHGTIKNLNIVDSYFGGASFCGNENYGSIVNCSSSATIGNSSNTSGGICESNNGFVEACTFTGKIFATSDSAYIGGICGMNRSVIKNCYSGAAIDGRSGIGGISGTNRGTVENCCCTGKITIPDNYQGKVSYGIAEGTVVNSYYINTSMNSGSSAVAVSQAQFESGEVAYKLGEAWGQKIGTEASPTLGGDKVYYVTNCNGENIYSNKNENGQHNFVNGSCAFCGLILAEINLIKLAIERLNTMAETNNVLESKKEPLNDIYQDLLLIETPGDMAPVGSGLDLVKTALASYKVQLQSGIADGTWIKADYTEIDAAVAEVESSGAITDKISVKLEEIESELSVMKVNSETSKADVAVLMKEVELLKDCVSGNHILENGKCTICGAEESVDKLAGYTISLDDKIAVNYYMSLTEKTINDANAKMVFTVPDTGSTYTLEIPVKDAVKSGDLFVFTCEVAVKEMTSVIEAKFVTSTDELVLDDYTVQEYAEVILSDTVKYAKEQELVKKMLNYGAEAQIYFNYNTDNLANDTEYMTEEEKEVELFGFAGAPFVLEGEESGVTYYGTALALETELAFKHYFIIDESVDVDSLEISCVYPVALKKNGSYYELVISKIPAHKMGENSIKVTIGGITLDYTIYSYGALAQSAGKTELWTLVSALTHFAQEATVYAYK